MRVVLIYRKPYPEGYSIEELFKSIALEMGKCVEVIQYIAGSWFKLFLDVWNLRRLKADIYHVTGSINYMVCFLPRRKTVLTMHDIVHYMYTLKGYKRFVYKYLWLLAPIYYTAKVTSISTETVTNITRELGITNKTIHVIPNCYNPIFQAVNKQFNNTCPTIFQIGTLPHKNLPRLIMALKDLPCRLILIGRLDKITINLLEQYKIIYENYVGITLQEIYQHYINSDIVSFISLHEGFGVPIIEAQAVGRALITTNYAPMSEVAMDGACLVDPHDVEQIRLNIIRIINEPEYRDTLINNGFMNVKNYSADSISMKYIDLYKQMS